MLIKDPSMAVIAGLLAQGWNRGLLAEPSVGGRAASIAQVLHSNNGQYFVLVKMVPGGPVTLLLRMYPALTLARG